MRNDKLEVDNPMYLRDLEARDAAEDETEIEDAVFSLEEKVRSLSSEGWPRAGGVPDKRSLPCVPWIDLSAPGFCQHRSGLVASLPASRLGSDVLAWVQFPLWEPAFRVPFGPVERFLKPMSSL